MVCAIVFTGRLLTLPRNEAQQASHEPNSLRSLKVLARSGLPGTSMARRLWTRFCCFDEKSFADDARRSAKQRIDEPSTIQCDLHASPGLKRFRPPIQKPYGLAAAVEQQPVCCHV